MPRRLLLAFFSAALLVATPLAAVHADEQTTTQPVIVVMDYSSSMLEKDADAKGTTRIDAAKSATKHLINNSPDDATMGLVVYGSKTAKKCDDIITVQKPGKVNKSELTAKLDELKAVGETPIGASLLYAANEMKDIKTEKSIILVSDGEENCDEPPACEAAKDLAGQGIDLTVHTIGFKVNNTARSQLECIAKATGGTYVTADDSDALQEELTSRTLRAFQGYTATGTPIEGGAQLHQAPLMVPGQYLDSLEKGETKTWTSKDGTTKYYKVGPLKPGEYAHFSATMIPAQQKKSEKSDPTRVSVELVNGQGANCSTGQSQITNTNQLGRPLTGYTRSPEYLQDTTHGCFADGSGELYAKVTRDGAMFKDDPMAVELRYVLEPAVDPTLLGAPASTKDKPQSVTLTGNAEPVLGGSSFNDALPVDSAKIYADSIMSSEARYYKIHVGNGQKLNIRATGGNNQDSGVQAIGAMVYSPVRKNVDLIGESKVNGYKPGEVSTQSMDTPVDQSNFDNHIGKDNYLGGEYYVVVYADTWSSKSNGVPFDYELAVEVTGTEKEFAGAAPIFEATQSSSEPGDEPSTAPTSESSPKPGPTAEGAEENQPPTQQSGQKSIEQTSVTSGSLWPWFTAGLLITAALLGAGTFLFRHRSTAMVEQRTDVDPTLPGDR